MLILIADDEPHILNLLNMILKPKYDIIACEDGEQVLRALKTAKPDLLILDVMMPKVNGFEICEKLKKNPLTKNLKIAILSAKAGEKDIIEGLRLGADYYLTKPFDPVDFEKRIDDMLK